MTNSPAIITVAGVAVAVNILDTTRTRRITRRIVESLPVDGPWPVDAAEIARRAKEIFVGYSCRAVAEDVAWCIGKIDLADIAADAYGESRYIVRVVATEDAALKLYRAARDEAEDGLVGA